MNATFSIAHEKLIADPRFAGLGAALAPLSPIDSTATFNRYCRTACRSWREQLPQPIGQTSPLFAELLDKIDRREDKVIPTSWGGVVITLHEHPRVEKYLVVRAGGYLALEKHEQKDEHLEVREGAGLILWRRLADQPLALQPLESGSRFHLEPGHEHCLIGTEDLLVFERSLDPKGMDQDLIFIYEPDAP